MIELTCFRDDKSAFEYHEITFDGKMANISSANPAKCLACHGADPRPNWNAYSFWPGAYGATSAGNESYIYKQAPEYPAHEAFMSGNRYKGRYAFLPKEMTDLVAPQPGDRYVVVANAHNTDPSGDLTEELSALNEKRIARILKSSPGFAAAKELIQGASSQCDNWEGFVPDRLRGRLRCRLHHEPDHSNRE